ncbi:mediator of RNA polymerase II transcription subunit 5 [Xylona heveae TC161]|uniref:Mediator of RNA polymerase II transcription subunit 5 n=1 Tax=Xylona heveae (strain CBS 132557 / TC161) TaxID=1328760 RepID=A0A165J6S2_XYLHT|nr:mediator of RNA polymerase II transcription subunit 5 [Xylona heveae TC161]KZF25812.1 mediator of RNA polymerase II transcription subunit 5 [Xylona heveae TC161]
MSSDTEWTRFLDRSLDARIRPDKFATLSTALHHRTPLSGSKVADIFLKPRSPASLRADPLLLPYVEQLLDRDRINTADALRALLKFSRFHHAHEAIEDSRNVGEPAEKWYNSAEVEETLMYRIARAISIQQSPKSKSEALGTLKILAQWMSAMVSSGTRDEMMQDMDGTARQVDPETVALRGALGTLVLALTENLPFIETINDSCPKDLKKAFIHSLSMFVPFLSQTALQIANRLDAFHKLISVSDNAFKSLDGGVMSGLGGSLQLQSMADVIDGPVVNSRAGLYIYLNAVLVGRPLVDDTAFLNYLHARYKADVSSLTIELITASFDVLSNAMYRNETSQTMFLFRSFLVNKIPVLVAILAGSMFPPLTAEFCITQALNHVDPNAFPSFSQMFDPLSGSGMLSDVRQEFLFACALHQLIPEESIESLLGEIPMQTLPSGGRYVKEDLVQQCSTNSEKIEELLGEIEGMDGNAGAIVSAITDIIHNLCASKETMSLKSICSSLSKRPLSLDVLLLFNNPSHLLQPVCQLLDEWRFEEDQGEYQPVYDEFGCVLLLVLAFVHRYDLTAAEVGATNPDSFIARLLNKRSLGQRMEDLTEEQKNYLGGWIRGLFDAEGISDELMSACRPQEFYFLVPTLFQQSLAACKLEVLDIETVKGGLEYLLETFLLPSLVGAITWLADRLWESGDDINILMQMLHTLLRPSSISGDARAMHNTILSIVAKPLEHSLREFRRLGSPRQDIDPLLDLLKPHLSFKRTVDSYHTEYEQWMGPQSGGLLASIRNTFQSLVLWSSTAEINMTPPSYTHRQLLVAVKLFGAKAPVRAIIDELRLQSENGSGDLAMDVATSLVSAPSATDGAELKTSLSPESKGRLTLRDALKLEVEDAEAAFAADPLRAELVVRLHRRVEAQTAAPSGMTAAGQGTTATNIPVPPGLMGSIDVSGVASGAGPDTMDLTGAGASMDMLDVGGDGFWRHGSDGC